MILDWNLHHLESPDVETAKSHADKNYSDFALFEYRENRMWWNGGKILIYSVIYSDMLYFFYNYLKSDLQLLNFVVLVK